jgi:hypothetical protein
MMGRFILALAKSYSFYLCDTDSGFGSFLLAETLASHSIDLTSEFLSKYGFFTLVMNLMFEHLGIMTSSPMQFRKNIITCQARLCK